jgi:hypothetical protein
MSGSAPVPQYAPPRGLSISSTVLGVISLFFGFTLIAPGVGLVLGIMGARREPAGRGFAIAGIVLNVIALAGWVLAVLLVLFVFGVAAVGVGAATAG